MPLAALHASLIYPSSLCLAPTTFLDEFAALHTDEHARLEAMIERVKYKDEEISALTARLHAQRHTVDELMQQKQQFNDFVQKSKAAFDGKQEQLRRVLSKMRQEGKVAAEEIAKRDEYAESLKRALSRVAADQDGHDAQVQALVEQQDRHQKALEADLLIMAGEQEQQQEQDTARLPSIGGLGGGGGGGGDSAAVFAAAASATV